jgi:CrcB protein
LVSGLIARQYGETFPWGTMAVNLIGCLLTGAIFNLTEERFLVSPTLRTMILIGLMGGFTTFSSYGLQTFTLLRDGEFGLATLNIGVSNALGLLLVWAGYASVKFCEVDYDYSRGRLPVTHFRGRVIATVIIHFMNRSF